MAIRILTISETKAALSLTAGLSDLRDISQSIQVHRFAESSIKGWQFGDGKSRSGQPPASRCPDAVKRPTISVA